MQKLVIKQFGPLKDLEIYDKPLTVLIGPQASGKSTIAKLFYFFKSIKTELLNYFIHIERINEPYGIPNFLYDQYHRLLNIFGFEFDSQFDNIKFFYSENKYLSLESEENDRFIKFSDDLNFDIEEFYNKNKSQFNNNYLFDKELNIIFEDNLELNFIPANRSIFSILYGQYNTIALKELDFLRSEFIGKVTEVQKKINLIFQKKLLYENTFIDNKKVNDRLAISLISIESILKGIYSNDNQGVKINFENDNFILIQDASSGQQEALWALLLLLVNIIEGKNKFTVFEEPEAHLFPESQKDIIDLLAVYLNSGTNQAFITTHSPYILSSLNNLIYAHILAQKNGNMEKVKEIIPEETWIDPNIVQVFYVDKGGIRSIIDKETGMINTEEIDNASRMINEKFNQLFDLED
jgi:energy-coupling factor transporter ATP-binding protein EcfA2